MPPPLPRRLLDKVRTEIMPSALSSDRPSALLSLQSTAGNRAVGTLVNVQRNKKVAAGVAAQVKANNGKAPSGYEGGRVFENDEGHLPAKDSKGKALTYWEYDVYPLSNDRGRGSVRVVIDSNWTAWYTKDHYKSFSSLSY